MTKLNSMSLGLLALAVGPLACNVHDNTINATANIPNATLNLTADTDVNNVMPSQAVPMTVMVTNVTLVEPTATPPAGHDMDAGHFEFHLDDETTPPLLVTAQTEVQVPIPAETKAGPHKNHLPPAQARWHADGDEVRGRYHREGERDGRRYRWNDRRNWR